MNKPTLLALSLVLATACGPSTKEAEQPKGDGMPADHEHGDGGEHGHDHGDKHEHGEDHEHGDDHGKEHPKMTGAVKSFHDVLAPVFHMDKGAARVEKTCAALASLKEQAGLVTGEAKDDGQKTRAAKLTAEVVALDKGCAASGRATVEADLEKVHDAFHAVMENK